MDHQSLFREATGARLPVIMAPMFLVSNLAMLKSAMHSGVPGVFPSLNFRKEGELESVITALKNINLNFPGAATYGVNLIVQRSNPFAEKHLDICTSLKVPFFITSLGSPEKVIRQATVYGAKVYCDVTNLAHADKCASLGCHGFIAVGQGAGGHAGPHPLTVLVPALRKNFPGIPVVAAGGIATGDGIISMLALGASAVSIGTRFLASSEAPVPDTYKQAVIDSGMDDIVMTDRLSGTPCTIINTPYAKQIGYRQNFLEKWLGKNSTTKKYFKMLVQVQGMKKLEQAVKPGNYNNLWCAGKSAELIENILSCEEIIKNLETEMKSCLDKLKKN